MSKNDEPVYKGKVLPLSHNEDGSTNAVYFDGEGRAAEAVLHTEESAKGVDPENTYDMKATFKPGDPLGDAELRPREGTKGPPLVNSEAYRQGWERIFGNKDIAEA